jgi:hypothetical protein
MKNISTTTHEILNVLPGLQYLGDSFLPGEWNNLFSHFSRIIAIVGGALEEKIKGEE